jgi:hypothetical protein
MQRRPGSPSALMLDVNLPDTQAIPLALHEEGSFIIDHHTRYHHRRHHHR